MSREWIAVYPALRDLPKFSGLQAADRGALLQVWMLASATAPEATFRSLDYLAGLLELDGFDRDAASRLLEAGWLDADGSGRVLVHDWDDHQLAATRAITLAFEADRKRTWRRERRLVSPTPPSTEQDMTLHNRTSGQRPDSPGQVPDTSGRNGKSSKKTNWDDFDEPWQPFLEVWRERFKYPPTETQRSALWPLVDARPNDAADWLRAASGKTSFEVVGQVIGRWKTFEAAT